MKRDAYKPDQATGAHVEKNGEQWTLVLIRDLKHPPEKVWKALTDPKELSEWAPFDADRNLTAVGPVKLSTIGAPHISETQVTRVEAPKLLEYSWGGNEVRWELEPLGDGTRLKLWHNIDRRYISLGAAGWHICFDVLTQFLTGEPMGRIVGMEAMKFDWSRLNQEYAKQFGVDAPSGPPQAKEKTT